MTSHAEPHPAQSPRSRPVHDGETTLAQWMRTPAYKEWRAGVESVKGYLQPVRLIGEFEVRHMGSGELIASRQGRVWASCGTRRAAVCPTCADRYAADAWHLIHAGMTGGKGVPRHGSPIHPASGR